MVARVAQTIIILPRHLNGLESLKLISLRSENSRMDRIALIEAEDSSFLASRGEKKADSQPLFLSSMHLVSREILPAYLHSIPDV